MDLTQYTFPELINELETFFNNYTIEEFVVCPTKEIKNLKPKEERVCRFCGLDSSQTTFEKRPHIISELLGNKYLISDFECDICNLFFSDYETNLANFLGISRTIFSVKNKGKIPEFNSLGNKLVTSRKEFYGIKDGLKISRDKSTKGIFNINAQTGKTEIKYLKPSYTPIKFYKALLKIALSIIPEKYVKDYQYALYYLFNHDDKLSTLAKVVRYELPYEHKVDNPICYLFKKLNPTNRIITHVFALYFQNYVFELPIPLYKSDLNSNLYNEKLDFLFCPPLLLKQAVENNYFKFIKDLSSNEKVREEEFIIFEFDPNTINNLKAYNPTTGEATDTTLNADDITEIYITSSNSKISFPKDQ